MKVITIYNMDDGDLEGIVLSNVTTGEEIEKILGNLKDELPGEWDFEDLKMRLPADCMFMYAEDTEKVFE